jgi:hypothetical protein
MSLLLRQRHCFNLLTTFIEGIVGNSIIVRKRLTTREAVTSSAKSVAATPPTISLSLTTVLLTSWRLIKLSYDSSSRENASTTPRSLAGWRSSDLLSLVPFHEIYYKVSLLIFLVTASILVVIHCCCKQPSMFLSFLIVQTPKQFT